jgi:RNA polymerase sigma-70 factor (ECF subfamily)
VKNPASSDLPSALAVASRPPTAAPVASTQTAIDRALLDRFVGGDESAFAEIMVDHRQKLFDLAFDMLHNRGDAEEIVQDTFIRAHRNLGGFRRESSLRTWLCQIALNLARNRYWYFRRRFRHLAISLDWSAPAGGQESAQGIRDYLSDGCPDPAHEASRQEFSALMTDCLTRLDPPHRRVLGDRFIKDCSYDEIGADLGISTGTVKSRISRARRRLREEIAAACPEISFDELTRPYRNTEVGGLISAA